MRVLLVLTAVLEAATGLALMIFPSLVTELLLGERISGAPIAVGRVAGFGLLSLGLACWPSSEAPRRLATALRAMLTYNLLITVYLVYLGIGGQWVGLLLWPVAVIHAALTLLLARAWFKDRSEGSDLMKPARTTDA